MHDHAGGVDDMAQVRGGELGRRGGDAGGDALEPLVDGLCVELPRNDATADLLEIRVDGTGKKLAAEADDQDLQEMTQDTEFDDS